MEDWLDLILVGGFSLLAYFWLRKYWFRLLYGVGRKKKKSNGKWFP